MNPDEVKDLKDFKVVVKLTYYLLFDLKFPYVLKEKEWKYYYERALDQKYTVEQALERIIHDYSEENKNGKTN